MLGMSSGLAANNPTVVAAFHHVLVQQGLVVLLVVAVALAFPGLWRWLQWRARERSGALASTPVVGGEPPARRLLRVSFGIIWIFDGLMQLKAAMPLGLVPQVIQPAAAGSPAWVLHVVEFGTRIWTYHPVSAAASAVWIQMGIGVWLLVAPRGFWSRLGGLGSVAWAVIVWVFGEAFGSVFAPGLTWLTGAPGAALVYAAAGVLLVFPEGWWSRSQLGKAILRVMGLFFLGMALLQAWPKRGFWQGRSAGTLVEAVRQMAATPQPHWLASWVGGFGDFDAAHGWAVNLFVVIALAFIGVTLVTARRQLALIGVGVAILVGLADWVLVEDLGFLGGTGTDPNNMIPITLLVVAGYLAITRLPDAENAKVVPISAPASSWKQRALGASPIYMYRVVLTLVAVGIVLVGAVPMAPASADPHASTVLTQAIDGAPQAVGKPAPAFHLVDQTGQSVSLASLRGKVVVMVFLDDVCVSQCPIIAQELRVADRLLGSRARRVEMVAINANPRFTAPAYLAAFDRQEDLGTMPNWLYLSGPVSRLHRVWRSYGVTVTYLPAGAMVGHSLYAYVIGPHGQLRYVLGTDPGPATGATRSSFTVTLAETVKEVLRS